jgi:hypothetical protein
MVATPQFITTLLDNPRRAFPGPALDRLEHAITGKRVTPDDPMQLPGYNSLRKVYADLRITLVVCRN